MIENKKKNSINDPQLNIEHGIYLENRHEQDRRSELSEGFAFISTVGWIDRRERLRRKDDPFNF